MVGPGRDAGVRGGDAHRARRSTPLAAYLVWLRDNGDEGGLQLGRVGAVAEGLVAVVVGLGS